MISAAFRGCGTFFASLFPRAGVMLLSRYLRRSTRVNASSVHSQQAASSMSDHRTAADVVTTALQNVGDRSEDAAAAILAALEAENIQWAWQLSRLSAEQWTARLSVCTLGLQIAIQDALIDQPQQLGREVVLTPLLRNFLLLPAEDGSPPKRLNSLSAIFYSLLLTPSPSARRCSSPSVSSSR